MDSFKLDGETIVMVLRQRKMNGTIAADIPQDIMFEMAKIRELGTITMVFQKGEVVTCSLATRSGRVLTHDQTTLFKVLPLAGILQWQLSLSSTTTRLPPSLPAIQPSQSARHLTPAETPSLPPAPESVLWQRIPYRLREIQVSQIQDLTLRKVYQLIDGQRSAEKMSILSRIPPQMVITALQQLYAQGIIEFRQH